MSKIVTDYHMHSVSPDARVPMEQMCQAAVEHGLTEIAMTDHMEFFPKNSSNAEWGLFNEAYIESYFEHLEQCRDRFAGKLVIRCASELGQPIENPEEAAAYINGRPFDFLLGSIHSMHDVDLAFKVYTDATVERISGDYLDCLWQLVDTSDFDVLGHFDLVKRYAARKGCRADVMHQRDRVAEILRRAVERGKGLEINTSGLRQGLGETMPALDLLQLYRDLGGEILTIGSDAHYPHDVGAGLEDARQLALAAGFHRLSLFDRRACSFYSID